VGEEEGGFPLERGSYDGKKYFFFGVSLRSLGWTKNERSRRNICCIESSLGLFVCS
jgi:hypothetical protein